MKAKRTRGADPGVIGYAILDVDGPIGGFNFQSAFSTGHAAGISL